MDSSSYLTQGHNPAANLNQWADSAFDSKVAITNVTFINYKLDYTKDSNPNFAQCMSNLIFIQGNNPDTSARVYLKGTQNINGDYISTQLREPDSRVLNWTGGCGDFNCTGYKNWILTDTDGSFLGFKGQNDGPDQRARIISPVTVSSPNFYGELNEWREWKWFEKEPLNFRLARFNGMVERNQSMWLRFLVKVPDQLKFKLERFDDP